MKKKTVMEYIIGIDREFKTKINKEFDYYELTASQARILGFITHSSECVCSRDVENHFDLTHPTVNGIIKRLEAKGMVYSEQSKSDKRVRNLYITEKAKLLDKKIQKLICDNENKIIATLSEDEQKVLLELLKKMYHKLKEE